MFEDNYWAKLITAFLTIFHDKFAVITDKEWILIFEELATRDRTCDFPKALNNESTILINTINYMDTSTLILVIQCWQFQIMLKYLNKAVNYCSMFFETCCSNLERVRLKHQSCIDQIDIINVEFNKLLDLIRNIALQRTKVYEEFHNAYYSDNYRNIDELTMESIKAFDDMKLNLSDFISWLPIISDVANIPKELLKSIKYCRDLYKQNHEHSVFCTILIEKISAIFYTDTYDQYNECINEIFIATTTTLGDNQMHITELEAAAVNDTLTLSVGQFRLPLASELFDD